MSDKARKTYPIAINILNGELPSGAKLTALSTQAQSSANLLEFMIGDPWNAAGDPVLSPGATNPNINALYQANLVRSIGQMNLVNSLIPGTTSGSDSGPLDNGMFYTDNIGARYSGESEGYLKFVPRDTPTVSNMTVLGGGTDVIQGNFQTDPTNLTITGDWHVSATGKLYTYSNIPAALKLQYIATVPSDSQSVDNGSVPGWNVIPDPNNASGAFAGVKISYVNDVDDTAGYHIWLPPRVPFDTGKTFDRSFDSTVTENVNSLPDATPTVPFQSTSVAASLSNGDHYRYNLPDEITGLAAGTTLPSGFLYLWDNQKASIVEGVAFSVPANTAQSKWKLVATGATLTDTFNSAGITVSADGDHAPTAYTNEFQFIVGGASVARSIFSLWKTLLNDKRDNTGLTPQISHAVLDDLVTPPYHASFNPNYPSIAPTFVKSDWQNDDHPQYLHRAGSTGQTLPGSGSSHRGDDDNAVYGQIKITDGNLSPAGLLNLLAPIGGYAQVLAGEFSGLRIGNFDLSATITFEDETTEQLSIVGRDGISLWSTGAGGTFQGVVIEDPIIFNNDTPATTPRIRFSNLTTPTAVLGAALPDDYLEFDETDTFIFAVGDSSNLSKVEAGQYTYGSTGKTQRYTVQASDFIVSTDADLAAQPPIYSGASLSNPHATVTHIFYAPLHLPDGAIIRTSHTQTAHMAGNDTDSIIFTIFEVTDKTSGGGTSRLALSRSSNTRGNETGSVSSDITINSLTTGNYVYLRLDMPDTNGGAGTPFFYNATIVYDLPTVNN